MQRGESLDFESFRRWDGRPWGSPWAAQPEVTAAAQTITGIGLGRGMCYGMCPVYQVTLERSGAATFDGEYFVALMGPHRARLDPAAFCDLAMAVAYLGFDTFEPHYEAAATDMATAAVWVDRDGARATVVDDGDAGPEALALIRNLIDQFASTLDWQPIVPSSASEAGPPIFVGSSLGRDDLPPRADDDGAHWTQRRR